MSSNYFVKLQQFEGPLDLLLHLVREHQLDIFDIDLLVLTRQYLEYLRHVRFKDLADAAGFLQMAAFLIERKAKQLLPNEKDSASDNDDEEEDPTKTLEYRLQQYEQFKKAASFFEARVSNESYVRSNLEWQRQEPLYQEVEAPLRADATTLVVLYEQLLSTMDDKKPARVTAITHKVTVAEVIEKMLKDVEELEFKFFQGEYQHMTARYDLVANVLAMLQLVRDGKMNIHQEQMMGPIWLYSKQTSLDSLISRLQKEKDNSAAYPIGPMPAEQETTVTEPIDGVSIDR